MDDRCRIPSVRCSIRCSCCANVFALLRARPQGSRSGPAVAASRASVLDLFDKHQDANAYVRAATLSWTQAQVQLRHLGMTAEEANLFQRIAGHVLYADATMRPSSAAIQRGSNTRSGAVGAGHFRRFAHRVAQDRTHRGHCHRPAVAAGPRVLAIEAARCRSRDPERTCRFVRAGSADCSGDGCSYQSFASAASRRQYQGRGVRVAHGYHFSRNTRRVVLRRSSGVRRHARHACGSTRPSQRDCG